MRGPAALAVLLCLTGCATQAFDLQVFNTGDYLQAVRSQAFAENISKVL